MVEIESRTENFQIVKTIAWALWALGLLKFQQTNGRSRWTFNNLSGSY